MRKMVLYAVLSLLLVLNLGNQASAAEMTGTLRVTLGGSEGEVALYRVGVKAEGGYLLLDTYGGGFLREEDAMSSTLAQWLAETEGREVQYRILDADGSADFSRLEKGLYLLTQTQTQPGTYPFNPFLIAIPYEFRWHIQANPKVESEPPSTGQGMEPFLGLLGMVLSGTGLLACALTKKRK